MASSNVAVDGVQIAKDLFAAIDKLDEQALVDVCTEDVEWIVPGEWVGAGTHRGRAGLVHLFRIATGAADITSSKRHEFIVQGNRVLVIGVAIGKVKATNKSFEDEFIFSITLRDGKVSHVREYIDTLAVARAFNPTL